MENLPDSPLISIVIPVYNGANYMRQAIESALSQTYQNKEILVVNDGSDDDGETEKIALSYGEKIRYFHKENGGVSSALNVGIREMRGEYFSWLSHDDYYLPDKLEKQVPLASPDAIVMCGRFLVDKDSKILGDVRETMRFHERCTVEAQKALLALFEQGCFNGCTLLIPKRAFERAGTFREDLRYCQDLLMWIQIFLKGFRLEFLPDKLVASRVHGKQLTNTGRSLFHKESILLCDAVLDDFCEMGEQGKAILFAFAKFNAVYGNHSVVSRCLLAGKTKKLLSAWERAKIRAFSCYGSVRPIIRKWYYKLFKKV